MIAFRDQHGRAARLDCSSTPTPTGLTREINPFDARQQQVHRRHEDRGAAQALNAGGFDARSAVPAATRRSRAPRSASSRFRDRGHQWDPKNQRPELWSLYNTKVNGREHARVPALELDRARRLALHLAEKIPIVPLYFAKPRPVVSRHGT
jgi:sulfate adenylyltransferase subunit 2